MKTKYESVEFFQEDYTEDIKRLINQIWKLIPMRENGEDWQRQLSNVIIEVAGLQEIFTDQVNFLIILSKMEGLKVTDISFEHYRLNVFSIIDLLNKNI